AGHDHTARVWDARTGQLLLPPLKHAALVLHAAFSPDGRFLVTASSDQTARVWEADTGQALTPAWKHANALVQAAFSPDSRGVVTASFDGTAHLWELHAEPRPAADLLAWAELLAGARMDERIGMVPISGAAIQPIWQALRSRY